jgi:hypothetical protein
MKKYFVKWALEVIRNLYSHTYFTLEEYGINDLISVEDAKTGEKELIIYIPR